MMRSRRRRQHAIKHGTFSHLPDLSDDDMKKRVGTGSTRSIAIEHTNDPHPRSVYWEMWGPPMFDIEDASAALEEVKKCREAFPNQTSR